MEQVVVKDVSDEVVIEELNEDNLRLEGDKQQKLSPKEDKNSNRDRNEAKNMIITESVLEKVDKVEKEVEKEVEKAVEKAVEKEIMVEKKVEQAVEVVEHGKLLKVTSKGIKYFVYEKENPQKLYEFNQEKNPQKVVGKRTKTSNKYKVELFDS